jgi:hypothetical protein
LQLPCRRCGAGAVGRSQGRRMPTGASLRLAIAPAPSSHLKRNRRLIHDRRHHLPSPQGSPCTLPLELYVLPDSGRLITPRYVLSPRTSDLGPRTSKNEWS